MTSAPSGPVAGLTGRHLGREGLVDLFLHTVSVYALAEVALRVQDAYPDQVQAEVRGALDVVAGQDAQAARVDRQRLVQPELGREVRDRPPEAGVHVLHPGVSRFQIVVEAAQGQVVGGDEAGVAGGGFQVLRLCQQPDRIVLRTFPQLGV
jgi:hypothetical protein